MIFRYAQPAAVAYPPMLMLMLMLMLMPMPMPMPVMVMVMVKTPAHPVAVLPPKIGATGGCQVECSDTGVCALHLDDRGRMQGFALTGSETSRRNTLAKELAA